MCTYLTKRGATYYFRRKVPDELRPAMGGKVEFMVSAKPAAAHVHDCSQWE